MQNKTDDTYTRRERNEKTNHSGRSCVRCMLCSCGKNKATTFTTDDIDTFVNSVNGNSGSPESVSPYNYDDDSDLYDSDGYGDYNSEDSSAWGF